VALCRRAATNIARSFLTLRVWRNFSNVKKPPKFRFYFSIFGHFTQESTISANLPILKLIAVFFERNGVFASKTAVKIFCLDKGQIIG
jgi:hypothetical protein